jgi:hypothetical protein
MMPFVMKVINSSIICGKKSTADLISKPTTESKTTVARVIPVKVNPRILQFLRLSRRSIRSNQRVLKFAGGAGSGAILKR